MPRPAPAACRGPLAGPVALVLARRRWHLAAWDVRDGAWTLLPVDGETIEATDVPAGDRGEPAADLDAWATARVADSTQAVRAVVRAHAPAAAVRPAIAAAWGTVEAEGEDRCLVRCGADSLDTVARWLLLLGCPLTVLEPPELRDAFATVATAAAQVANS